MGIQPAARFTDNHICTKHGGGPIKKPTYKDKILVNGLLHARATGKATCNGPDDVIVTGAATVYVAGQPSARVNEKTMHGGYIPPPCSPNVFIGGPSTGVTIGDPEGVGEELCKAASLGRAGQTMHQNYENCGLECIRPIINKLSDENFDEFGMLDWALKNSHKADAFGLKITGNMYARSVFKQDGSLDLDLSGGTSSLDWAVIFSEFDIGAQLDEPSIDVVTQGLSEGSPVISSHESSTWYGDQDSTSNHAVTATGATYDSEGNVTDMHVNDTGGSGGCNKTVPISKYVNSMKGYVVRPLKKMW